MPYSSSALSVRIADRLTELIAQRRFLPGEKLPSEPELAQELQVSRTTLREALRILTTRGLVEVRRGVGTFVTESKSVLADHDVVKFQRTRVRTKDL